MIEKLLFCCFSWIEQLRKPNLDTNFPPTVGKGWSLRRTIADLLRCHSDPKMVVLVGMDAISGGIFEGSPALDRRFLDNHKVDLYIAGNPAHPLTVINGLLALTGRE